MAEVSGAQKSSGQRGGKPLSTNWLARFDKTARKLPPTNSWLQPYDYFVLTRYPRLQPRDPVLPDLPGGYRRGGRQTYEQQLQKQENVISEKVPRALKGISAKQRREVAALVSGLTTRLEEHVNRGAEPKEIEKRRREVLRLERTLQKNSEGVEK